MLLFRTRAGSLEVNRRTHRFNLAKSKLCHFCELRGYEIDETITHILTECPAYESEMDWAVGKFKEIIGENEFEMKRQDDDGGLCFFLGLEENVPGGVVQITKEYISRVWRIRDSEIGRWRQEAGRREDVRENLV